MSLLDKLAADFAPDFTPDQVLEFNKGMAAPDARLGSMETWPDRWHLGGKGWIQWYKDQEAGIASEHDERQKGRWRSYKARHGAQYVKNPTPRRAVSMRNWGIDAPKLLPEDQRETARQAIAEYLQKKSSVAQHGLKLLRGAVTGGRDALVGGFNAAKSAPTGSMLSSARSAAKDGWYGIDGHFTARAGLKGLQESMPVASRVAGHFYRNVVPYGAAAGGYAARGLLAKSSADSVDKLWDPWAASSGDACYRFDLKDTEGLFAENEVDDLGRPKKKT